MKSLLLLACLLGMNAAAQVSNPNLLAPANPLIGYGLDRSAPFFSGTDGQPIRYNNEVVLVSGSPYLYTQFLPAKVVLSSGMAYDGVRMRLNLLDHQLEYLNEKAEPRVATHAVQELFLRDTLSGALHQFVAAGQLPAPLPVKGWLEVLVQGKASLYKWRQRVLLSRKGYGSATEEKWVEHTDRYFVVCNQQGYEVKKPKDLSTPFAGKTALLQSLLRNGSKAETEQQLVAAVKQYNTL